MKTDASFFLPADRVYQVYELQQLAVLGITTNSHMATFQKHRMYRMQTLHWASVRWNSEPCECSLQVHETYLTMKQTFAAKFLLLCAASDLFWIENKSAAIDEATNSPQKLTL